MRLVHILSGGAAALALFLALAPQVRAQEQPGAWAERVQVLYDAETRSVVRRKLRVWDFHPERNLDFTWDPADGARAAIAPDGTVNGEGKLAWRVRGAASYDSSALFATYAGRLVAGRPEGQGRLVLRSGESFEGSWRAGLLEGRGVHVDASGARYEGAFRAGRYDGQGRLALPTGEVYAGPFHAGLRDGEGETLLPGGARYVSRWQAGVEAPGARARVMADGGVSGLLKADTAGGDAGRAEIAVAIDGRMNQQSVDERGMSYAQAVRDEDILIFAGEKPMRDAWNGKGEVTTDVSAFDRFEWDNEPLFLEVGVRTSDGKRARLDGLKLAVAESQAYRKPMFSLERHVGCIGFRPDFSLVNHGWGNPRDTVVKLSFTGREPGGPRSRAFTVPVGAFDKGVDVSVAEALREAGVDTTKLAEKRYTCQSKESMGVCQAQLFNDVGFGEIADFVWSDEYRTDQFFTTAVGTIDYDWSDDAGATYHASEPFRVDISLATIQVPIELAECGDGFGGAPEARRYQDIHLEPGKTGYAIDLAVRGNRNTASYTARLKVFAPMSSYHRFRIAAKFADGSVRESKPVTLFFFRPRPSDFQTKTQPAPEACYLSSAGAGGC